ncbi:MAG: radical SAM protein [Thermoplasmata archaeon]|nr:MAG: radical SAM protein [Thermoplasmata archaeon]
MKINEIFYSIQGEGILIGIPTIFIRTTGCNLRCNWCDTKYAYEEGEELTIEEIIAKEKEYPATNICLTGGEPLLQNETPALIQRLSEEDYFICLETNGSKSVQELPCLDSLLISLDVKCPSSGMQDKIDKSNIELLGPNDQLKFIISDKEDYEYAKNVMREQEPNCTVIMTRVGGIELSELAEWVLKDGLNVLVLPQLHKLIWGDKRGV